VCRTSELASEREKSLVAVATNPLESASFSCVRGKFWARHTGVPFAAYFVPYTDVGHKMITRILLIKALVRA
jgi:hypothetical protein